MNREKIEIGDIVHVYNRGNRKAPIVFNREDKWRFLKSLYYFNNQESLSKPFSQQDFSFQVFSKNKGEQIFLKWSWPESWPERKPLVEILCFFLADNHFHLLLKEKQERGISRFMSKLGTGYTNYINLRYEQVGRVFQGPYKSKIVSDTKYLYLLIIYILIINFFDFYPKGFEIAKQNFDKAINLAASYSFSSFLDMLKKRDLGIIEQNSIVQEMFPNLDAFKKEFIKEIVLKKDIRKSLGSLAID